MPETFTFANVQTNGTLRFGFCLLNPKTRVALCIIRCSILSSPDSSTEFDGLNLSARARLTVGNLYYYVRTCTTTSWLPWHDMFYSLLTLLSKELYALASPDHQHEHQPPPGIGAGTGAGANKPQHECLLEQLYAIDVLNIGHLVGQEIGVAASSAPNALVSHTHIHTLCFQSTSPPITCYY